MSSTQVTIPEAPPPPTYIFREHTSTVNSAHLFDNDQYIASCDGEGWIIIWSMRTKRPLLKWKGHKESCLKVTTIKNNQLISQGRDNMIYLWQLPLLQEITTLQLISPDLISEIVYNGLSFCKLSSYQNKESTLLCFPSLNELGLFDIYDLTYQRYLMRNMGDSGPLRLGSCMAVELFRTCDNLFVLAGYESGIVALWEIQKDSTRIIWHQHIHAEPVLDLSIDPSKSFLISSSADNQIVKYALATGDIIKKITIKKSGIVAIKIRPDNKIFATGGFDGRIRVFSMKSMKPLAVLSYHRNTTYGLDFSHQGNWLIGSSQDNRISLWSIY